MRIATLVIDILKLGLTGLVFLMMYMGFRLLQQEQRKPVPNAKVLNRTSLFVWQSLLVAVLVGAVEIGHRLVPERQHADGAYKTCLQEIDSLNLVSQHPSQSVDTLRSAIRNTALVCREPGSEADAK